MKITIETTVRAPLPRVWECFNNAEHVVHWNNASSDWHTPRAENDFRQGGAFNYRMEARDGSFGFDFKGIYDEVRPMQWVAYTMEDGRKVEIAFRVEPGEVRIVETFEAETENTPEKQREGWQSILNNFKRYVEENK